MQRTRLSTEPPHHFSAPALPPSAFRTCCFSTKTHKPIRSPDLRPEYRTMSPSLAFAENRNNRIMAPQRFTAFENIAPGTADWKIRVRVIRMWKQTEYNNPRQIKSIELILLDEKTKTIQATIKRSLFEQFESLIEEGYAYVIENLLVAQIDPKFKPTKHKYKLTFMRSTKCCKTETNSIPKTYFDFLPFTKIIGAVDEGFLFDVIGHVVQRGNMKETTTNVGKTNLLDIALEDLESNRVICTLWGQFAEDMNAYLDKNKEGGAVIMILQLCKLRTFGGMIGISNSFHGTKLWINADLPEVKEYKDRLGNGNVTATQTVSQMSLWTALNQLQTKRTRIKRNLKFV